LKRLSKFIIWSMAYIGCMSTVMSWSIPDALFFGLQFIGVLSFFIWTFYESKPAFKTSRESEEDMTAIIFTRDDLNRLNNNDAIVMTTDDGLEIYFMSEECYTQSYEDKFV